MQKWMQCLVWDDAEMKRGERGFLRKVIMLRILKNCNFLNQSFYIKLEMGYFNLAITTA